MKNFTLLLISNPVFNITFWYVKYSISTVMHNEKYNWGFSRFKASNMKIREFIEKQGDYIIHVVKFFQSSTCPRLLDETYQIESSIIWQYIVELYFHSQKDDNTRHRQFFIFEIHEEYK